MADIDNGVPLETPPRIVGVFAPQPWNVISPRVYRYEDQQWIDAFFETGHLRLSSFQQCRAYEDEHRGDSAEGFGHSYAEMPDGKSMMVTLAQGSDAYLFCCTHNLDRDLQATFGRNSAFKIMDPMAFGLSIAAVLPKFKFGFEGSCIYRDYGIRRAVDFTLEDFRRPDGSFEMAFLEKAIADLGGPERMLLKRKRYIRQQEYRMMWFVDGEVAPFIEVECPAARQFCAKVKDFEW